MVDVSMLHSDDMSCSFFFYRRVLFAALYAADKLAHEEAVANGGVSLHSSSERHVKRSEQTPNCSLSCIGMAFRIQRLA
jgi:hypothetical protein